MIKIVAKLKGLDILQILIMASLCLVGLFHEFLSCIVSVALLIILFRVIKHNNYAIKFRVDLSSVTITVIGLSYLFSSIWAVDSGVAIFGFVKFLPIFLFLLLLLQSDYSEDKILEIVPATMVIMTVISAVLMQFDIFENFFSVAGRLSGFFQYANTYALMALVALIIEITKDKISKIQLINISVLLFGIVYSGSRTVFLLTAFVVLILVILVKNKRIKFALLSMFVLVVGLAVVYATVTGKFYSIGRFLTISLTDSTLVGRLLYWQDALKVIIKHPFGTGYMGFYYLQQSIQTGVYSIKSVHNDFLQIMLDIGWVPAVLLLATIIKAFFKKGNSIRNRLLLFVISAHASFDFDLQFVAVFMVLVILLNQSGGKEHTFRKKPLTICALTVLIFINIYFGFVLLLSYFNLVNLSTKIYPCNTRDNTSLLTEMNDAFAMDKFADKIIKQNKYVTIAYDAKALYSYSIGDIETMIIYKDKALSISSFTYEEYYDYCDKLVNAIELYNSSGDKESADYCIEKLNEVVDKLYSTSNSASKYGKMIKDQLETELPSNVLAYVEEQ